MTPIPLELLAAGELAVIDVLAGEAAAIHRLEELGFRAGIELEMVRPGECCIVRLGERKLGFRPEATASILVRQIATGVAT